MTHDGVACQFLPLSSKVLCFRSFFVFDVFSCKNVTLTRGKYLVLQEGPPGEWTIGETNDDTIKLN